MSTLYELTAQMQQLLEMAEDPDIDEQVLADTMEGIEGEFEDKADGYAKVLAQLGAQQMALDHEIERLSARMKTIERNIKVMKDGLQQSMMVTGKTKFKTSLFSFAIAKNPASLVIDDEDAVPEAYKVPQPPKIDKKKIKEDLKAGAQLDWCHLTQTESLRIK